MQRRHLAIDLGAESGRVILGSFEDGKVILQEIHRFATGSFRLGGFLLVDVYRIYEEIQEGLRRFSREYGRELQSIGVDAWGSDFGLLDATGSLIGLPFSYRDSRTEGLDAFVESTIGYRHLHELTNHRRTETGTLHQMIAMARDQGPSLVNGRAILFIGDIFNYFLSGKICSEYSAASYSQMFNVRKSDWEPEVFQIFGLPLGICSHIVYPGDDLGLLNPCLAAATGLGDVRVIAPAVHDTGDAVLAIPAQGESWGFISSGTWSLLGIESDVPIVNDQSYAGNFTNSGLAFGKILFKISIAGLWIIQQCRNAWTASGIELDYSTIADTAEKAEAFNAIIDVEAEDFFNPADMPSAIVDFVTRTGQGRIDSCDFGKIARIVYESLALRYRQGIELTQEASGKKLSVIHIVGGGSKISLLNRFTASACRLPVLAGPAEATAIGNLMIQAYGCGEVASLSDIRAQVRSSFPPVVFEPFMTDAWDASYQKFLEVSHRDPG